jgi:DNA-binding transcriptional LysR family regulator
MPTVARALLHEFPDLRLDLELRDDSSIAPGKRPDVQVLVAPPDYTGTREARAHHLLDDPYVAVVPWEHPLAGQGPVELVRLAGERWIDNDFARGWCRENLLRACQAAGFTPPFRVEAHDYPTAIAFVEAGIGITVVPRLGAESLPPGVVAVPLISPTPTRSIFALVQTSAESAPPAQCALRALRSCAAPA